MNRKVLIVAFVAVLIVGLVPAAGAQEAKFKIGLAVPTTGDTYYGAINDGAAAAADELGVTLVVAASESEEAADVQDLIDQGVNAILLTPADPETSLDAIAAANEADIPVFLLGSDVDSTLGEVEVNVVSRILPDGATEGELAATTLCGALNEAGTVIELLPVDLTPADNADEPESASVTSILERHDSFTAAMTEQCPDVVIQPLDTTGLTHDEVVDAFAAVLGEEKVNGVFAYTSDQVLSAMEASIVARSRGITFVSFQVTEDAVAAIQEGRLTAVITSSGTEVGRIGMETAVAYLNGTEIESLIPVDSIVLNLESLATFRCASCNRPER